MTTQDIRNKIKIYAEQLSSKNINIAYEFISYLADKESEEATRELLEIPNLLEEIEEAKKEINEEFDWRDLRKDV